MLKTIRAACRSSLTVFLCLAVTVAAEAAVWMIRDHLIASAQETEIEAVRVEARAKALALRETLSRTLDQIAALQSIAGLVTKARRSGDAEMEKAARNELGVRRRHHDQQRDGESSASARPLSGLVECRSEPLSRLVR